MFVLLGLSIILLAVGTIFIFYSKGKDENKPKLTKTPEVSKEEKISHEGALAIVKEIYENDYLIVEDTKKVEGDFYVFYQVNKETGLKISKLLIHNKTLEVRVEPVSSNEEEEPVQ